MSELTDVVGRISPVLGSLLGAFVPGGSLLIAALGALFGVSSGNTDDIAKAIQADPDAIVKLRQFEIAHQDAILDSQTKIRLGAYQREAEIVKATGHRDWVLDALALGTVGGYFIIGTMIFFVKIDPTMSGIVNFMCGELSTAAMMVLAYFFGATFRHQGVVPQGRRTDQLLPPPSQSQ